MGRVTLAAQLCFVLLDRFIHVLNAPDGVLTVRLA
jgi:hypothetical protein